MDEARGFVVVKGEMDKALNSNWRIYQFCAGLLIVKCLWRVLVPAHEYASSLSIWLGMGIDVLLLVGLVGLYRQFSTVMEQGDDRAATMRLLFWPALAAGIVIFLIRFSGDSGWATGHWRYSID